MGIRTGRERTALLGAAAAAVMILILLAAGRIVHPLGDTHPAAVTEIRITRVYVSAEDTTGETARTGSEIHAGRAAGDGVRVISLPGEEGMAACAPLRRNLPLALGSLLAAAGAVCAICGRRLQRTGKEA